MEEKFVSEIKRIPHKAEHIYGMLSDLSNLERVKDRIPAGKVKDFTFDSDSCSVSVDPVGKICFQIVEREPNQLIKFATTNSPIPLHLSIERGGRGRHMHETDRRGRVESLHQTNGG